MIWLAIVMTITPAGVPAQSMPPLKFIKPFNTIQECVDAASMGNTNGVVVMRAQIKPLPKGQAMLCMKPIYPV